MFAIYKINLTKRQMKYPNDVMGISCRSIIETLDIEHSS